MPWALSHKLGWLESYQASMVIAERLAQAHGSNAVLQRDLSVLHSKIGDVFRSQGDLGKALESYQASMVIAEPLAQTHASNAVLRDLLVLHKKIGDVFGDQGNLSEALERYQLAMAFAERLAEADPNVATWQRYLALGHGRIANLQAKRKERD